MSITEFGVEFEANNLALDADGTVILGMVESEYRLYPERLVLRFTEVMSGIPLTAVSVGTNAPNYDNIASAVSLASVQANTARQVNLLVAGGTIAAIPPSSEVRARVNHTTGNGGKVDVSLIGFYQSISQA